MHSHSRFGDQPLIEIMRRRRWTFSLLSSEVGVTCRHLYYVAHGHIVPSPKLRDRLPAVLGAPLSEVHSGCARRSTPGAEQRAARDRPQDRLVAPPAEHELLRRDYEAKGAVAVETQTRSSGSSG
jgi:hypothetical protein